MLILQWKANMTSPKMFLIFLNMGCFGLPRELLHPLLHRYLHCHVYWILLPAFNFHHHQCMSLPTSYSYLWQKCCSANLFNGGQGFANQKQNIPPTRIKSHRRKLDRAHYQLRPHTEESFLRLNVFAKEEIGIKVNARTDERSWHLILIWIFFFLLLLVCIFNCCIIIGSTG